MNSRLPKMKFSEVASGKKTQPARLGPTKTVRRHRWGREQSSSAKQSSSINNEYESFVFDAHYLWQPLYIARAVQEVFIGQDNVLVADHKL